MVFARNTYPEAKYPDKVGSYDLETSSGGGHFYDEVLEYRVWYKLDGEGYCYCSSTLKGAKDYYIKTSGAEEPIVLVGQTKHVNENSAGKFKVDDKPRMTEWQIDWLKGSERNRKNVEQFAKKHDLDNKFVEQLLG